MCLRKPERYLKFPRLTAIERANTMLKPQIQTDPQIYTSTLNIKVSFSPNLQDHLPPANAKEADQRNHTYAGWPLIESIPRKVIMPADAGSSTHDNAPSIAAKMPTLIDAKNRTLTATQLAALDKNHDGEISIREAASLRLWRDLNENGFLDAGELGAVDRTIKRDDYSQLLRNGPIEEMPILMKDVPSTMSLIIDSAQPLPDDIAPIIAGTDGVDFLIGRSTSDSILGGFGNDVIYGGDGEDFLVGFGKLDSSKDSLAADESDDDSLYGGEGKDTVFGGLGNDYLDGGAGADTMIGAAGNDIYVTNSINDYISELAEDGYDTVLASTDYVLNANVEELRLIEGQSIHGTGNALNNLIVGNTSGNILDGMTGADTLKGGAGNDIYFVDNHEDVVVEKANEGHDTVISSVSHKLGKNVENLVLGDFSMSEKGLLNGRSVLVYGHLRRHELDYHQGNAVPNYHGTCGLVTIANMLTQSGRPTSESEVVKLAIKNNWALNETNNPEVTSSYLGGTFLAEQRKILESYDVDNETLDGYKEARLAELVRAGHLVKVSLNAGHLWNHPGSVLSGSTNHAVTLTGVVYNEDDGSLAGFYIADSGRGLVGDMTRFIDIDLFRQAVDVEGANALYSTEPLKLWKEDINATGNSRNNILMGNRGNNGLYGLAGNDTLVGGAGNDTLNGGRGNDTYRFAAGFGVDQIVDVDKTRGNVDVIEFTSGAAANQLWFKRNGNDLEISIIGRSDKVFVTGWYESASSRVEKIRSSDGKVLNKSQVDALVSAMGAFTPPTAGQTSLPADYQSALNAVLAANWKLAA